MSTFFQSRIFAFGPLRNTGAEPYIVSMSKAFVLVLMVMCALYGYVAYRMVTPLTLIMPLKYALYVLFGLAPLLQIGIMQRRMSDRDSPGLLESLAFVSMGAFWIGLCEVLVREVIYWILAAVGRLPADFLHLSTLGLWALIIGSVLVSLYEARRIPRILKVDVPVEGLPEALEGYRIAQISDLHISSQIGPDFVRQVVDTTNAEAPDAIALTGDIVDTSVRVGLEAATLLGDLKAKDGVLYATGNHEYYQGVEPWLVELRKIGLEVLLNEHRSFERGEAKIVIAGLTDKSGEQFSPAHKMDPTKALEGAAEASFKVALAHQPRVAPDLAKAGFDLCLSGHTHGGQIFPWNYLVRLQQPTVAGLAKVGKMILYTSRGTGYWGPPMRLLAPSEITLLTLRAKAV